MGRRGEYRWSPMGYRARKMAETEGYIMARYTGCIPFVITKKQWDEMSKEPPATQGKEE